MSRKRSRRARGGTKAGAQEGTEDSGRGSKRPRGQAAVGFLRSQGTRSFRKRRSVGG